MRLIVTGVDGFVSRSLALLARDEGIELVGVGSNPSAGDDVVSLFSEFHAVDLLTEWPENVRGDAIVHLPGHAPVGPSFAHPQSYVADDAAITIRMCEWMLATPAMQATRVVGISSGNVYRGSALPLDEAAPSASTSPYSIGKVLVEHLLDYYRIRGLDTVVARPFNHIGPGQPAGTLIPDLVRRLRALGPGEELTVGNLESRRDYTDVRDVARAYLTLAAGDRPLKAVYNVASGVARSGHEVLETICRALDRPVPPLRVDVAQQRQVDTEVFVGDARRIESEFGWNPRIGFEQSIADYVTEAGLR